MAFVFAVMLHAYFITSSEASLSARETILRVTVAMFQQQETVALIQPFRMRATQPLLSPWWPALKFYWFNGAKQLQVMDLSFEREKIALFIGEIEQQRSAWMGKGEGEQGQPLPPWFHFILVSRHRRGRNWNRVRYDSTMLFPLPPTAKTPLCPSLGVLSRFQHKWGAGVNKESHTCTEKAQKCTP